MTASAVTHEAAEFRRWLFSGATVLAVYASVFAASCISRSSEDVDTSEPSGAIAVDFSLEARGPSMEKTDVAPGPEQTASEAKPLIAAPQETAEQTPPADAVPTANPDVVIPPKAVETPPNAKAPTPAVPTTSAPQVIAERTDRTAAAPLEGVPDPRKSKAVATWRSLVTTVIEKNKRYPDQARAQRVQGITVVYFTLDATGHVVSSRIDSGSGSTLLDEEAVSLLRRAEPFPPPPTVLGGGTVAVHMPIKFTIR